MVKNKTNKYNMTAPLFIFALLISFVVAISQTNSFEQTNTDYTTPEDEAWWTIDEAQQKEYTDRKPIKRVIIQDCDPSHISCDKLKEGSKTIDPYNMKTKPFLSFPTKVSFSAPDPVSETGYMNLEDGTAQYWWISHHGKAPTSLLYVKMSDGSEMFMEGGGTCCEARISGKTLSDLKNYLLIFDDSNLRKIEKRLGL